MRREEWDRIIAFPMPDVNLHLPHEGHKPESVGPHCYTHDVVNLRKVLRLHLIFLRSYILE